MPLSVILSGNFLDNSVLKRCCPGRCPSFGSTLGRRHVTQTRSSDGDCCFIVITHVSGEFGGCWLKSHPPAPAHPVRINHVLWQVSRLSDLGSWRAHGCVSFPARGASGRVQPLRIRSRGRLCSPNKTSAAKFPFHLTDVGTSAHVMHRLRSICQAVEIQWPTYLPERARVARCR